MNTNSMERTCYGAIDGLRTIACIGIVMMHVRNNNTYDIPGFVYEKLIPSFADFVYLFMVISAFGMCCGYLDKVLNNKISLESFYLKRYAKILPFFSLLVLLDIVLFPSKTSIMEGFADVTLLFGLFPNNITVIGIGWFLGLVFAFYLIFPFYCTILKNKKRAWIVFIISIALNYVCGELFGVGRHNIIYCLCYFMIGGLIYLYRKELEMFSHKYWWFVLVAICASAALYFIVGKNIITRLLISSLMLLFAIGNSGGVLQNSVTKFFSSISMEVYLSHMVIFRAIEKFGLNKSIGDGWFQYGLTVMLTMVGAVTFSVAVKKGLELVIDILHQ